MSLLPTGKAWKFSENDIGMRIIRAIAREFQRIEDRKNQLILEMTPKTASEMLEDWEQALNIPIDKSKDIQVRRDAVTYKLLHRRFEPSQEGFNSLAKSVDVIVKKYIEYSYERGGYQSSSFNNVCTIIIDEERTETQNIDRFKRLVQAYTPAHVSIIYHIP